MDFDYYLAIFKEYHTDRMLSMIITSRKNEMAVKSKRLLSEKKFRDKEGLFGAEGVKLAQEALLAGIGAEYALASETAEKRFPDCMDMLKKSCRVFTVSDEVYSYISEQKTPQGIFLAGKILDKSQNLDRILENNKILMLDCVQDSGNLGTMLRTAEALGTDGVVMSTDCADIWSPKTLRASMGSVFRLSLCSAELSGAVERAAEKGFTVYAAMLDQGAEALGTFKFPKKTAVVIGNEGHGVSPQVAERCKKLYIPIVGAESLNAAAAAAVICWEMKAGGCKK